eukprot:10729811-Alexandrium_andersonii.AAC.1
MHSNASRSPANETSTRYAAMGWGRSGETAVAHATACDTWCNDTQQWTAEACRGSLRGQYSARREGGN